MQLCLDVNTTGGWRLRDAERRSDRQFLCRHATREFVNLFWPHFDTLIWPHPLLFIETLPEERAVRGGSLVSPPAMRLMDGDAWPPEDGWTACRFR